MQNEFVFLTCSSIYVLSFNSSTVCTLKCVAGNRDIIVENKTHKCKQQTGTVRENFLKKFSECKLRIIKFTLKKN